MIEVKLDWPAKSATLRFVGVKDAVIRVFDLRSLNVSRYEPWGPSASVYDAEYDPEHPLGNWLMLRMQTGDYFEIVARSIVLEEVD